MSPSRAAHWFFPAFLILCTVTSFAWGIYGFILWWAMVLSFFAISVILGLLGIFLPDPGLWLLDRLRVRKLRMKK